MPYQNLYFEGVPVPAMRAGLRKREAAPSRPADTGSEPVDGFVRELLRCANLSVAAYRGTALRRRTAACLRFLGVSSVDEGIQRIESDPALVQPALNVALLGVTEFFRDGAVFERLRDAVLPGLFGRHGALRVWSAGCSAGHELYSVVMLLAEMGRLADVELLGTDCRAAAIEQARSGAFDCETTAGLAPYWQERFFTRSGRWLLVNADLRWATRWQVADLLSTVEPGPWHLILWRNMAIYLESAAADDVWVRLTRQLAPGGYIVCGKADHPPATLPLVRVGRCFYQLSGSA